MQKLHEESLFSQTFIWQFNKMYHGYSDPQWRLQQDEAFLAPSVQWCKLRERTEWKNGNCDSLSSWRSQKIHIHLWIMTIPILSDNAKITYLKIHFDLIIESVERHSWPSLAQPTPIIHSVAAVRTSNRETGSCVSQKWDGKLREQRKLLKLVSLCLIWPKL